MLEIPLAVFYGQRKEERLIADAERDAVVLASVVAAIPGAVEQILDNTIDNGGRVSSPGSTVEISIQSDQTNSTISFRDHGPGLSDEDKTRALQRFWRGDQSQPGTELGLAIAIAIADTPGGGLTITARLRNLPHLQTTDPSASGSVSGERSP